MRMQWHISRSLLCLKKASRRWLLPKCRAFQGALRCAAKDLLRYSIQRHNIFHQKRAKLMQEAESAANAKTSRDKDTGALPLLLEDTAPTEEANSPSEEPQPEGMAFSSEDARSLKDLCEGIGAHRSLGVAQRI